MNYDKERIISAYKGTKTSEYTKWENLRVFLKLTEGMKYNEIAKVINAKSDSFRKKLIAFKRANKFISNFNPNHYNRIELCITAFQKINAKDWNVVLDKFKENNE